MADPGTVELTDLESESYDNGTVVEQKPAKEEKKIAPIPTRNSDGRFATQELDADEAKMPPMPAQDGAEADEEPLDDAEAVTSGEEGAEEAKAPQKDFHKPRHSAKLRVEQATRKAREERIARASAEKELAELRARMEALEAGKTDPAQPQQAKEPDGPPSPDNYPDYESYVRAQARHEARDEIQQTLREHQSRSRMVAYKREIDGKVDSYQKALDGASKADPQFYERLSTEVLNLQPSFVMPPGSNLDVYNGIADEILTSGDAPRLMLYLSEQPSELQRLATLTPRDLVRAMAKIEAGLGAATSGKPARPASQAKPPVQPVPGSPLSEDADAPADSDTFDAFFAKSNRKDKVQGPRR